MAEPTPGEQQENLKIQSNSDSENAQMNQNQTPGQWKRPQRQRNVVIFSEKQLKKALRVHPVRYGRILYQSCFFSIGLVILVLSIQAYKESVGKENDFHLLAQNWQGDAIVEFKLATSSQRCNDTYLGYEDVFFYKWPGSMEGCDCTFNRRLIQQKELELKKDRNISLILKSYFQKGKRCILQQIESGCRTVNELINYQLSLWSDGSFGKPFKMCAKRVKGLNYVNNVTRGQNCSIELKRCGSAEGDKFFCVNSTTPCPITDVGFKTISQSKAWNITINELDIKFYEQIQGLLQEKNLDEAAKLGGIIDIGRSLQFYYFRREASKAPISEFRISETFNDQGVCLKNEQGNISPDREDYVLMKEQRTSCLNDDRFVNFHRIDEYQFYLANNMIFLTEVLPYYQIDQKYNWGLFYRDYLNWNMECRGAYLEEVILEGQTLDEIEQVQSVQLGLTIFFFIVISNIFSLVSCLSACGLEWSCIDKKGSHQYNYIFLAEFTLKTLFQLMEIVIIIVTFAMTKHKKEFFDDLIARDCTDDNKIKYTFLQIRDDLYAKNWQYNLALLIIFVITATFDIIMFMVALNQKEHLHESRRLIKHKKQQEKQEKIQKEREKEKEKEKEDEILKERQLLDEDQQFDFNLKQDKKKEIEQPLSNQNEQQFEQKQSVHLEGNNNITPDENKEQNNHKQEEQHQEK